MSSVYDHGRDVLVVKGVLQQCQGFGFGELVTACTIGMCFVSVHEVHVQIDAPPCILVVSAVLVVVVAFTGQIEAGSLACFAIRFGVKAWIVGIRDVIGLSWVVDAHHRNLAVPVDVIGTILVLCAITVGVVTAHVPWMVSMHIGSEVVFVPVRIESRNNVDRVAFQQVDDRVVAIGSTFQQQ